MSKNSSLLIYEDSGEFIALSAITRDPLERGPDAATVINAALLRLKREGGGAIELAAGLYPLASALHLPSRVMLSGGGEATRLHVTDQNQDGNGIVAQEAQGITIKDLVVEATPGTETANVGIHLVRCADVRVTGVTARSFARYGIVIEGTTLNGRISDCTAAGNRLANFRFYDVRGWHKDPYGDFPPCLIIGCQTYRGGIGFEIERSLLINLVGCLAYQANEQAFYFHGKSASIVMSGCRAFQTEKQAVLLDGASEMNISSSTFCWQKGHGIEVTNSCWGTISANCIMDSGASGDEYRHHLYLHTDVKGFQFASNTLFTWADQRPTKSAIRETDDCRDNHFSSNNINYFKEDALDIRGERSVAEHNFWQQDAFPNPQPEPFAAPRPSHGSYINPFDCLRLDAYLQQLAPPPSA